MAGVAYVLNGICPHRDSKSTCQEWRMFRMECVNMEIVCSYFRSVHFTTFLAIPTVSRRDAPGSGGLLNTTDQKADTQSSLQWNQLRPKVGVNITGRDRLLHKYIVFK
ncbi:hypothetical protein RRG08_045659 [Elysia crispata]|uniref:Uncharacterized protein n=1 Tax=Elysia crispata TaxID=231223 RepID=A0AAE0YLJ7_9GAST|nr:hypothetical protein RRG08_045659 [Elysia crispata]